MAAVQLMTWYYTELNGSIYRLLYEELLCLSYVIIHNSQLQYSIHFILRLMYLLKAYNRIRVIIMPCEEKNDWPII